MHKTHDVTRNSGSINCSSVCWPWYKSDEDMIREIEAIGGDFVLIIQCQKFNPPFIYRRCRATPTQQQKDLVFALSGGQTGVRSFSGESFPNGPCATSVYLGWNTMGFGFDKASCYCQACGYVLTEIARAKEVIVDSSTVSQDYIEEVRRKCEKTEIAFQIR